MENLLQLQNGAKAYGSKTLFEAASFAVNEGEHVGVIGPNGAGKTTLFKILVGEETLDGGDLFRSRRLRVGYLSQHDRWNPGETVESYLTSFPDDVDAVPIWELKSLGRSLGLAEEIYERTLDSLSGGYRMRAKILRLVAARPNLMLLDEPTNYLDLETLLVLEKFLQRYDGAFLLISHDREFLRRTTDHILEVEGGEITKYNGTIDDYFEQKELLRTQLEARAMSLAEKRAQILDFVARFGAKATKASQAQSRLKTLDKMETIEVKALPVTAKIRIPPPARTGKTILQFKGVSLGYGEKTVLKDVHLQLAAGQHLAVVGFNGAGKSTLLRALAGRLTPLAGTIEPGYEATFAFFHQHVAEELEMADTVFQALQRKAHPDVRPQDILDLAGSLLFSGDDVHKTVRVLSGGERSRVALGQVLLRKASCLVLDEPTNHLDFQTVEALTQSLHDYPGSLVVVSHDRGFIRRIATQILEIHGGRAAAYPGTYDEYVWSMEKGAFATLRGAPADTGAGGGGSGSSSGTGNGAGEKTSSAQYLEKRKAAERRRRQLETKIQDLDKKLARGSERIATLNADLAAAAPESSRGLIDEMAKLQSEINDWETEWMSASEELEAIRAEGTA